MGIVRTQTILSSLYIYLGVVLGFVSNMFFQPFGLTTEEIGIISLIYSISGVASIVFSLGFAQVILKKFNDFKTEDGSNHGFLTFILFFSFTGFLAYLIIALFFPGLVNQTQGFYTDVFFISLISITILFRIIFRNLNVYVRMGYNTTLGTFLESFLLKVILFVAFFLVRYDYIGFDTTFIMVILAFSMPGAVMMIYSLFKEKVKLPDTFLKATPKKEWLTLSTFGLITGTSSILILYTDQLMINYLMGPEALGVYSIMFFIGIFINIPSRGFKGISSAFMSDYWKKNKTEEIQDFYKRSSSNQGIISIYVFLCLWISIDDLLHILPPAFAAGKYVVFFIGLAQITDMFTGVNSEIIETSTLYKWNSYFNVSLVALTLINNLIFIQIYGIAGAALASFISLAVVNIARFSLLYRKFKFNPFTRYSILLLVILIGFTSLFLIYPIQLDFHPFVSIAIKCSLLSIVFWAIIIKLKVSEDINELLLKYYRKLIRR